MQKPVLIASAALICAAVIGIAVYATGSAKKDAGGFARHPPGTVSFTHPPAHETGRKIVCRPLL